MNSGFPPFWIEMSLASYLVVYIFHNREYECSNDSDFNTGNKCLTFVLLNQCYQYHKLSKAISKLYRSHPQLIKGLKTLLQQDILD